MNRILLASHGLLARGMKDTLEILTGDNPRIECLCAYVDEDSRDVARLIDAWEAQCDSQDWWCVVTDVYGGSVNNEFLRRLPDRSYTLVAGMNLPLLVELAMTIDALDAVHVERAVVACREAIQVCSLPQDELDEEDF